MLLRSPLLEEAGFRHAFPTRHAPDASLLDALGVARVVQVKQVHGARAVFADDPAGQEADAVVGRSEAVGVRVADCVPVLVGDRVSGAVAAIHAGWRGVEAGVVRAAVERLTGAASTSRPSLVAAIGPCIGPCCFEVGPDVARRLGFVVREAEERAFVDLRAAVRAQLAGLGVVAIEDVAGCTKHEPERFHSFRRDGANSGRMLAAIAARLP